ncbi:MAG TPA: FtsX-like permease family protein [Marmoricola sp.]|nr:FtsX-like permease family protein [Marmoricola sp.]
MRLLGGWATALRVARREVLRARGRSVLALLMIALPVLGVACADVLVHTAEVSGTEALDRRVGAADALVSFQEHQTWAAQQPDPVRGMTGGARGERQPDTRLSAVGAALGRPVRGIERHEGNVRVATDRGQADVRATELDLRDPLARGFYILQQGRLPGSRGEVVVNQALADHGVRLGGDLHVVDGPTLHVVGLVRDASSKEPGQVVTLPGTLDLHQDAHTVSWLVAGRGPVTWADVRALNHIGATVVSPWVLRHPPAADKVPTSVGGVDFGPNTAQVEVAVLVVVMALIEVVLLAGPAFAVGARRLQRTLALVASSGGTPRQLRRVVLATAVVLGAVAAAAGLVLGIVLARLLLPVLQRFDGSYFGPFDLRWSELLGIAAFGFVSAVLAAWVPAWLAARQDVVSVLAGRRGERPPRARSPLLGLLLLGLGVLGAVLGARRAAGGELLVAASAILSVLGMVLLIGIVLAGLGRASRRLPLALRYAVRDAARHRTRTVPAVASVAATVAGVVALGIGMASDEAQNRGTYQAALPMGSAVLTGAQGQEAWTGLVADARRESPRSRVVPVQGLPESVGDRGTRMVELSVGGGMPSFSYGSVYGSDLLVGSSMPAVDLGLSTRQRAVADRTLARGGAVALADHAVHGDRVRITVSTYDDHGGQVGRPRVATAPVLLLHPGGTSRFQAVVAPALARRLGVEPATVGLWLSGPVSDAAEQHLSDEATSANGSVYVERGYQASGSTRVVQLVLAVLGAVLMLGGTVTAAFLALADARSDLATLAAVGASPRLRRRVAASYAAVTGLVGAVLGVLVGFVPGVAVSFPLTSERYSGAPAGAPSHYLDIPWLLVLALVVVLPLLTAAVVGGASRSRLPMVARID